MNCRVCGDKTIKAHLIPRSMCTEVQVGKNHAVTNSDAKYSPSQSGVWDADILCANHDGQLGRYEETALKAFQNLRSQAANKSFGSYELTGTDSESLLKFFAAILYKYAITRKELGRIELGPFLAPIQDFLFCQAPVPRFLDALLVRPLLSAGDTEVFAYRTPRPDRKFGRNIYRMMVGGVIAFVLIDNSPLADPKTMGLWIKTLARPKYIIGPADQFEEFQIPQKLIQKNDTLSAFLGKQERTFGRT
ncbi:hypothetical protein [Massilia sp. TWR1-2-2]|uniref:hypothetical protein n=1 Tax=Massilia sp. TWR1-2-2 TaxID=2804584 RepID=UPI003CE7E109